MPETLKPRSLTLDDERPRPDSPDQASYLHHLARYEFALRWIQTHHRVLEAGCGTGYGAQLVARNAAYVLGGDYSPIAVDYARQHYSAPNLDYVVMDCEHLPVRQEQFDVILCFEVIEHLLDQGHFLRACYAALRPGGFLLVSTPNRVTANIHMDSIRMENEFHVGMLSVNEFRRTLCGVFRRAHMFGQRRRGNRAYSLLRSLDVFNLRLRLVPPAKRTTIQKQMGVAVGKGLQSRDWIFTRTQLRQSNNLLAICWK